MLFGKWKQKMIDMLGDNSSRIVDMQNKLTSGLDQAAEELKTFSEKRENSERQLTEQTKELSFAIESHNMAIEDLLDELQDQKEHRKIQKQLEAKLVQYELEQDKLLFLIMDYDSQVRLLKEAVNKAQDCAWTEQINMMAKKLSGDLSAHKIIVTGQPGEPVNFELHEVIQVSGTTDQTRDGLVERVIENGYMKDGRVLKKAKVSAYRI